MFSRSAERRGRQAVAALCFATAAASGLASPAPPIVGTWRGTSTCVQNPDFPACRDEVVIYEVREASAGGAAVKCSAYKIVDGEKQFMGDLEFVYDGKQGAWTSEFQNARAHGLWTFRVEGDALTGTLVDLPARHLVRNIAARREAAPGK